MATQDGRRLARKSSISSRVSLFSGLTSSSGSSGSTHTVTPETLRRSGKRNPMPARAYTKRHAAVRKRQEEPPEAPIMGSIDVFQFLDNSRSTNSSRLSLTGPPAPTSIDFVPRRTYQGPGRPESHRQKADSRATSIHSDSGISIRDSSPEAPSRRGSELEEVAEVAVTDHDTVALDLSNVVLPGSIPENSEADDDSFPEDHGALADEEPEIFYRGTRKREAQSVRDSVPTPPLPEESSPTHAKDGGYDVLAHRLSVKEIPALYRRFEWLHHRILLYLQDEVSELEEELQALDRWESESRLNAAKPGGGRGPPSSRRIDSGYQGSIELCARRIDVMGRIRVKVNQYDEALQAFYKAQSQLQSAKSETIHEYRTWMGKHRPIVEDEMRFLNHRDDLVHLGQKQTDHLEPISNDQSVLEIMVMTAAASIMLPLLAFSVIPTYFPRFCVAGFMALTLRWLFGMDRLRWLMRPAELRTCSLVYFGVMVMAAFVIR
ncbi:MAG: hypothetical protein Q9227_005123 [Pyrenula ochraceoflavens]